MRIYYRTLWQRAGVGRRGSWSLVGGVGADAVDMRWNIIEGLTLAIQRQNKLLRKQVPKHEC